MLCFAFEYYKVKNCDNIYYCDFVPVNRFNQLDCFWIGWLQIGATQSVCEIGQANPVCRMPLQCILQVNSRNESKTFQKKLTKSCITDLADLSRDSTTTCPACWSGVFAKRAKRRWRRESSDPISRWLGSCFISISKKRHSTNTIEESVDKNRRSLFQCHDVWSPFSTHRLMPGCRSSEVWPLRPSTTAYQFNSFRTSFFVCNTDFHPHALTFVPLIWMRINAARFVAVLKIHFDSSSISSFVWISRRTWLWWRVRRLWCKCTAADEWLSQHKNIK